VKLQRHGLTAGLLATALLLAACGGDDENTGGGSQQELSGSVRADGSSTVAPLTTAAAEFFAEEQPKVRVTVGTSGTGGGFEKFCNGETDVSDASRPIKDEETAACKAKNIEYGELTVANDALTVVVNKENTWAQCLTTAQLKKMWEPNQDKLKAVQINSGSGCVTPSVQTVQDGTYKPLARPLFIYPSVAAMKRPEVVAFVGYYVNNDGKIAEDAKFVPLNEEQKTKLKTEFESLKSKAGS
jgi:ABC-type phosphate transport system substrate-binding protein